MIKSDQANREDQTRAIASEYHLEHTCGCVREYLIFGTEEEKCYRARRISSVKCPDCFSFSVATDNAAPRCARCNEKVGCYGAICSDCQELDELSMIGFNGIDD